MIEALLDLAESAGKAIMAVRSSGQWTVQSKGDASPLTQADLAANAILMAGLTTLSSDPIVSEESLIPEITGSRFWLVDPLDGTKDFINGEETFVVCFALIESGAPVVSVVHAPVSGETWWATKNGGSFKRTKEDQSPRKISHPFPDRKLLAAGSRSIPSERMKSLYKLFGIERVDRFGSAKKFCLVAEGLYDIYPRFGPTSEWDTAAGQLICEEAGCRVLSIQTTKSMTYGKPGYLNGGFIAIRGDADTDALFARLKDEKLLPHQS